MRHKGSISQVNLERNKELLRLYKTAQGIVGSPATVNRVCQIMANLPTKKFYLSETYALKYIKDRINGKKRKFRHENKQILYNALWTSFLRIQGKKGNEGLSIERLVDITLETPAPIIGLSPTYITNFILRKHLNIRQYSHYDKKNRP